MNPGPTGYIPGALPTELPSLGYRKWIQQYDRLPIQHYKHKLQQLVTEHGILLASEVSNTLGNVMSVFIVVGGNASLVMVQATLL